MKFKTKVLTVRVLYWCAVVLAIVLGTLMYGCSSHASPLTATEQLVQAEIQKEVQAQTDRCMKELWLEGVVRCLPQEYINGRCVSFNSQAWCYQQALRKVL